MSFVESGETESNWRGPPALALTFALSTHSSVSIIPHVCDSPPTLSIILPGSAIDNAQGNDRATSLAGALARAAAVFCVDEVIVLDDGERRG